MALVPILFLLSIAVLFIMALNLMYRNLTSINSMLNSPVEVKRRHPEMTEVKTGDELLVVKFKPEVDAEGTVDLQFIPDRALEDRMLNKALENRIAELEDEDDDDDGDIPARLTPLR